MKSIMLNEKVNFDVLKKLCRLTFTQFNDLLSDNEGEEDNKEKDFDNKYHSQYFYLQEYYKLLLNSGGKFIRKSYQFAKRKKAGRLFVEGPGIQKFQKKIRGALVEGVYYDYDMINAQPSILLNLCYNHDVKAKYLKKYIEEREEKLEELMESLDIPRDTAKQLFIQCLFDKNLKTRYNKKKIDNAFFKSYDLEIKNIQEEFLKIYENRVGEIVVRNNNLPGQLLSLILCEQEDIIMRECASSAEVGVYMFDGFMSENKIEIQNLNCLSEKYGVEWSLKQNDLSLLDDLEEIDISGNKLSYVAKDHLDLRLFIMDNLLNGRLLRCENTLFYKDDLKWISDEKKIGIYLFNLISDNDFHIIHKKGYKSVCSDNSAIKDQIEFLTKKAPIDDNFKKWIWKDTLGKVYFKNGYWDFYQGKFISGKEDQRNTFIYVNRDFHLQRNNEIREQIFKKVYNPIFGTNKGEDQGQRQELLNFYLYQMARIMAGHYEDKLFLVMEGFRDCGKGMTTDFLKNTFGGYCKTTNADNFLYKPNNGDSAKNNSFLVEFEFCRLVSINEVPIAPDGKTTLCGNKIKKVSSGGDVIQARKNYMDEQDIILQCCFLFNWNDAPTITPSDAKEKQVLFRMESKFIKPGAKEEFSNIKYYTKNDSIKTDFITSEEVMNELAWIIFDSYKTKRTYPQKLLLEIEDEEETDFKKIIDFFDFTGNHSDIITNKELDMILKQLKIPFTKTKFKQILKGKGAKDFRNTKYRGLSGIQKKEDNNDSEDEF